MKILSIISGAPWWVYLIFAWILSIGIKSTKDQQKTFSQVLIIPVIFFLFSLYMFFTSKISILNLGYFSIISLFVVVGFLYGFSSFKRRKVNYDAALKKYNIPGTFETLTILLLFFACKYYIGYQKAINPNIADNVTNLMFILFGFTNGMFFGKISFLVNLSKQK